MQQQHGIQTLKPLQSTSDAGSKVRSIKCMFTTQLTKKRKTWSDGVLKVYFAGGCFQCSLIDTGKLRETVLASRPLERVEVDKLKKNEDAELEFENYLVTVAAGIDIDAVGPPLKLPKFVPPARYVPPPKPEIIPVQSAPPVSSAVGKPYKVTSDELDDLWDRDEASSAKPPAATAARAVESIQVPQQGSYYSAPKQNHQQVPQQPRTYQAGSSSGSCNDPSQPPVTAYFHQAAPVGSTQSDAAYRNPVSVSATGVAATGRVGVHVVRDIASASATTASSSAIGESRIAAQASVSSRGGSYYPMEHSARGGASSGAPHATAAAHPAYPVFPARPTAEATGYNTEQPPRHMSTTAALQPRVSDIRAAEPSTQKSSSASAPAYSTIISKSIWDDDD